MGVATETTVCIIRGDGGDICVSLLVLGGCCV